MWVWSFFNLRVVMVVKVFVIDAPTVAMFIGQIIHTKSVIVLDCSKKGFDQKSLALAVKMFIDPELVEKTIVLETSDIYFNKKTLIRAIFNLIKFELSCYFLYLKLKKVISFGYFIGPRTSKIMAAVPTCNKQLIDHGLGEPLERLENKKRKPIITFFSELIFRRFFCRAHSGGKILSFFNFQFDNLDIVIKRQLQIPKLQKSMTEAIICSKYLKLLNQNLTSLVLFGNTPHDGQSYLYEFSKADIAGNAAILEEAVLQIKHDEIIVVKFHPTINNCHHWLNEITKNLGDKLTKVYLWNDIFDHKLGSTMPVEILWNYTHVKKIYCEQSATVVLMRHLIKEGEFYFSKFDRNKKTKITKRLGFLIEQCSEKNINVS